jgi:hypothetical protein
VLPSIYDEYGQGAIIREGSRICSMDHAGWNALQKIETVQNDLPMSHDEAVRLTAIATVWLGCG